MSKLKSTLLFGMYYAYISFMAIAIFAFSVFSLIFSIPKWIYRKIKRCLKSDIADMY